MAGCRSASNVDVSLARIKHSPRNSSSRVPALPSKISSKGDLLEGYSTWRNSDRSCSFSNRRERNRRICLRKKHPTICKLSASDNFRQWPGCSNNGICLLVAGWAYVFSASLGERQGISMEYGKPLSSPAAPIKLDLHYATSREIRWWRALVSKGVGWSLGGAQVSPLALSIEDLGVEIEGGTDVEHPPPTAQQAAMYLARFCHAFDLDNQSSASLATALSIPLHATTNWSAVTIELPAPSFLVPAVPTTQSSIPHDYHLISYYMTLSLSFWAFGPAMWSVFWEPDVPCNFAGAWLAPIASVLGPIIESNNLKLLVKTLSFTNPAPLWLGVALCGPCAIIKIILPYLTKLADSLRHDCHGEYLNVGFEHIPLFGWPPFGRMQDKDVELEIRHHLECSHEWTYVDWTWLPSQEKDAGYRKTGSPVFGGIHVDDLTEEATSDDDDDDLHESPIVYKISRRATESVFWWCCEQVEEGFGGGIVPWRRGPDDKPKPPRKVKLNTTSIMKWLESLHIEEPAE